MTTLRSAALFDLDGTLLPNESAERSFFWHLLKKGKLTPINLFQMALALWYAKGSLHHMLRGNKRYLRNKRVDSLQLIARDYFEPQLLQIIYPSMKTIIEEHRQKGDLLLLLTGTLDIIADCVAKELRFDGYRAGTLQIRNGRYTGRLEGILPYGIGKLEVFKSLVQEFNFDRNKTVLYANIFSDRYIMNAVTTAVAVNPDKKLRRYATRMGWRVIDLTSSGHK